MNDQIRGSGVGKMEVGGKTPEEERLLNILLAEVGSRWLDRCSFRLASPMTLEWTSLPVLY